MNAKKYCSHSLFYFLEKKEYSLALRKACASLNLELVQLLLKFKSRIILKLDQTSSNGFNALDWAMQSKTAGPNSEYEKKMICNLLIEAGLKPLIITLDVQDDVVARNYP